MKVCGRCGVIQPSSNFHTRPNGKLYSWCKECSNTYQRKRYKFVLGFRLPKQEMRTRWVHTKFLVKYGEVVSEIFDAHAMSPNYEDLRDIEIEFSLRRL